MKDGRLGSAGICCRNSASLASCAGRSCACTLSCSILLRQLDVGLLLADGLLLDRCRIGPGGRDEQEPAGQQDQHDDGGCAERPDATARHGQPPDFGCSGWSRRQSVIETDEVKSTMSLSLIGSPMVGQAEVRVRVVVGLGQRGRARPRRCSACSADPVDRRRSRQPACRAATRPATVPSTSCVTVMRLEPDVRRDGQRQVVEHERVADLVAHGEVEVAPRPPRPAAYTLGTSAYFTTSACSVGVGGLGRRRARPRRRRPTGSPCTRGRRRRRPLRRRPGQGSRAGSGTSAPRRSPRAAG